MLVGFGIVSAVCIITATFTSVAHAVSPAAPTGLSVNPLSSCALQIQWNDSTNPDGMQYDVERDNVVVPDLAQKSGGNTVFDFNDEYLYSSGTMSPWYEASNSSTFLDPGTTFSYRVRAYDPNTGISSPWVGPQSAATFALPPAPGAPIGNVVTSTDGGNLKINFSTSTTSSLFFTYGRFQIFIATSSDGGATSQGFSLLENVPASATGFLQPDGSYTYEFTPPDKDWLYRFEIYAEEVGGLGCDYTRSTQVVLSASYAPLAVPARPQNPTASFDGSSINLTWTNAQVNPGINHVELQRSLDSSFSTLGLDANLSASAQSYTDSNVNVNTPTTYYYRVRACFDSGTAYCSFWSPTVSQGTAISQPQGVEARVAYATTTSGGSADVQIIWQESTILAGSTLFIQRQNPDGSTSTVAALGASDPSRQAMYYIDAGLPLGDTYAYRLEVVKGNDGSGWTSYMPAHLYLRYVLHGVAWASTQPGYGVGWVKFSSDNYNGSASTNFPYSVQVDTNGLMSGEAWAGAYGWLSFDQNDLTGCPSGACTANVDLTTGKLSGWARFVNSRNNWQGWDGWVHLAGAANDGTMYGVQFTSTSTAQTQLTGYAWGGSVGGWIKFSGTALDGSNYAVTATRVNTPPSVSTTGNTVTTPNWCEVTDSIATMVNWSDSDPDVFTAPGGTIVAAQVRFDDGAGDTYTTGNIDPAQWTCTSGNTSCTWNSGGESITLTNTNVSGSDQGNGVYTLKNPLGYSDSAKTYSDTPLIPGKTYEVYVQVADGFDKSGWVDTGAGVTMAPYYAPLPTVAWTPNPVTGPIVQFRDASIDRSGGVPSTDPIASYAWQACPSGSGCTYSQISNQAGASTTVVYTNFGNTGSDDINLVITGTNANFYSGNKYSCSVSYDVADGPTGAPTPPGGTTSTNTGAVKRRIFIEK